ncbi:MAG: hypothetical protein ACR2JD_00195 [Nocardioides sp.]
MNMAPPKIRAVTMSLALIGAVGLSAIAATAPAHADDAVTAPVAVSISKKRVITMPATIQPGVNTFHVSAAGKNSDFQLLQAEAGYTAEEAARDVEKGFEGKVRPLKRFEANVTLLGGVTASADHMGTLVVDLPVGTLWALDVNTDDPAKWLSFTVAGADTGNVMPASTTVKAKSSATWAKSPASIPNKGMLTFKNAASQNHFLEMVKLKRGKHLKDFNEWFLAPNGPAGPPPVDFSKSLSIGVISPGHSQTVDYKLPKGNYIMLCFWPDATMGGTPHAFMGMVREIKLK